METHEIIEVVSKFNSELYDVEKWAGEADFYDYVGLTYVEDGITRCVKLGSVFLWDDECDGRNSEIEGGKEVFEPLEGYLRRQVHKYISFLEGVKL